MSSRPAAPAEPAAPLRAAQSAAAGLALARIGLDVHELRRFCDRWKIAQLQVFGSALRTDFRPDSDVDLLVTFAPDANWGLFDHLRMQQDLASMIGRNVDIVSRRALERSANWVRRRAILERAEPLYAAG